MSLFNNQVDAFEDINASDVGSARSAFKQLENRRDVISVVNKPRVNKIADPNAIMQERRHKTYGDESEVEFSVFDCFYMGL